MGPICLSVSVLLCVIVGNFFTLRPVSLMVMLMLVAQKVVLVAHIFYFTFIEKLDGTKIIHYL